MGVEAGDLVDLCLAEAHFLGQRAQMCGGEAAICVLNEMQMLDQQVAAAGARAEQVADLLPGLIIELAALRCAAPFAACRFPDAFFVAVGIESHGRTFCCGFACFTSGGSGLAMQMRRKALSLRKRAFSKRAEFDKLAA